MAEIYKNIMIFLLMNSAVALSAYNLLRLFYSSSRADNALIFGVFFSLQVILTELLLGIFNILTLNNLIILNALILLLTVIFIRRPFPQREEMLFNDPGILRNQTVIFALSCIVGFGLVKIFFNLINPPFGWDCLNYHFSFPVEWIKNKNLLNPMVINCDPSPPYYPINGSLIFLWLMMPFKDVFLADLGQAPFFVLCFISTLSIARKIGIRNDYSYLAAALFVLIPNFFKQLEIAYVDTIFCSFFLMGVNFLLALRQEFNLKNLLLSALSLGLLFGTKTIAIPFGGVLSIFFILILLRQKNFKKAALYFALSGIIIIILGGFSYIRNFILTGNFLYPANFYIFGKKIFKGVLDISYYKAHYLAWDFSLAKLLFHEGFGAQTIIFTLPALFLSIPLTFKRNREKAGIEFIYFLLIPFLLYLAYRFIIPLSASRYLYPALAIGLVIAFYCAQTLKINKKIVYLLAIICIIASVSELARKIQILYSFLAAILSFGAIFYFSRRKLSGKFKTLLYLIAGILFIFSLGFLQRNYLCNEFSRYIKPLMAKPVFWPDAARAWVWLNEQTTGPLRIAYVGRPVPFPLYGSRFKNDVYYVSVNKGPAQLHAYPRGNYRRQKDYITLHKNLEEPGNYRENADYQTWLDNLLRLKTDYLFIYSLHQTKDIRFPLEENWAVNHPDRFNLVFKNETVRIYKIVN